MKASAREKWQLTTIAEKLTQATGVVYADVSIQAEL